MTNAGGDQGGSDAGGSGGDPGRIPAVRDVLRPDRPEGEERGLPGVQRRMRANGGQDNWITGGIMATAMNELARMGAMTLAHAQAEIRELMEKRKIDMETIARLALDKIELSRKVRELESVARLRNG